MGSEDIQICILIDYFNEGFLSILITITNYQLLLQNTKGNTLENVGNQTVLVTTDFYYIDKKHCEMSQNTVHYFILQKK